MDVGDVWTNVWTKIHVSRPGASSREEVLTFMRSAPAGRSGLVFGGDEEVVCPLEQLTTRVSSSQPVVGILVMSMTPCCSRGEVNHGNNEDHHAALANR